MILQLDIWLSKFDNALKTPILTILVIKNEKKEA